MNVKRGLLIIVISLLFMAGIEAMAQEAPSFALVSSSGNMVYRKELKGNLVVSFFASYCKPCKKELPALVEVIKKYEKSKGVTLVLITTDINDQAGDAVDKGREFLHDIGIDREFLVDMYHTAIMKYSPQKVVPATFLINRQGYVVFHEIGARDDTVARIERQIKALK